MLTFQVPGCRYVHFRLTASVLGVWATLAGAMSLGGCADRIKQPPLAEIYSKPAQLVAGDRNPVIVIPGILGSKLVDPATDQVVWGAFVYGAADADFPQGARQIALPMAAGASLASLQDEVMPAGVLETIDANVSLVKVTAIEPYRGIIRTLAAGGFVDREIASAKHRSSTQDAAIDYAGLHYTCFQFDYDWRRDITEHTARLDELIGSAAAIASNARGEETKVDVVAHSMGGLMLMYYLRYGTQPLPDDGSLPRQDWSGAKLVQRAILVGTPSAGSVLSVRQLVEGVQHAIITPTYRPAILGTMPAIYQLMPRTRHARVVGDQASSSPVDLYSIETWKANRWGLADPEQQKYIQWLLPDVADPADRSRIALDHLQKCLARAEQFHRAIDAPMGRLPDGLSLQLVLGDADKTPAVLKVQSDTGTLSVAATAPGDGAVTRSSALLDEREGNAFTPRLQSPIAWSHVTFLPTDHIGLTEHPVFVNQLLFQFLEEPASRPLQQPQADTAGNPPAP